MKYMWIIFLVPIAALVLSVLIKTFSIPSSQALQNKFASLGHLRGKNLDQIVSIVGDPQSISDLGNGTLLYQWLVPGYQIALIFDTNKICLGINNQFKTD